MSISVTDPLLVLILSCETKFIYELGLKLDMQTHCRDVFFTDFYASVMQKVVPFSTDDKHLFCLLNAEVALNKSVCTCGK